MERSKKDVLFLTIKLERSKKGETMKKIVVASHAKMAEGIQSTLELFVGTGMDITYMSAYVEDHPAIEEQISQFFEQLKDDDQALIFTDLFGGSVNQKMMEAAEGKSNVFLIAGFNLALIIELIYAAEVYTPELVADIVDKTKDTMVYVNKVEDDQQESIEDHVEKLSDEKETPVFTGTLPTTIRVDERLIHGQIAMVWSRELKLNGILVANDEASKNETQQMALKMAVPSGIKVLIRSVDDVAEILKDPRVQKKRLLVLVRTVKDALRLAEKIPHIEYINIGNVGKSIEGEKEVLSQFVMLTQTEMEALKDLVAIYPEAALQNLPSDKKVLASEFI